MRVRLDRLVLSGPQAPLVLRDLRARRGRKARRVPWARSGHKGRRVRLARTASAGTRKCSWKCRTPRSIREPIRSMSCSVRRVNNRSVAVSKRWRKRRAAQSDRVAPVRQFADGRLARPASQQHVEHGDHHGPRSRSLCDGSALGLLSARLAPDTGASRLSREDPKHPLLQLDGSSAAIMKVG